MLTTWDYLTYCPFLALGVEFHGYSPPVWSPGQAHQGAKRASLSRGAQPAGLYVSDISQLKGNDLICFLEGTISQAWIRFLIFCPGFS